MNVDFNITLSFLMNAGVLVCAAVGQWYIFRHRISESDKRVAYHQEEIVEIKNVINDLKIKIAQDLVPKSALSEVENRIVDRMTEQNKMLVDNMKGLTEEFREVRKIIMSNK